MSSRKTDNRDVVNLKTSLLQNPVKAHLHIRLHIRLHLLQLLQGNQNIYLLDFLFTAGITISQFTHIEKTHTHQEVL